MKQYAIVVVLIVLTVVLLHGQSIRYGLLLDDYNHRAELRDGDWSFQSLVEASHLGGHRRRVHMWWQEEADLYFFRPLSFFLMRLEYVIGNWRPEVMHVFSLGWTVVGAILVMMLAKTCLGNIRWACLAGVLFVMHPANYLTDRWFACQNEQMATAFMLCGLLCYGRYSGWRWNSAHKNRQGEFGFFICTLLCFVAALGCRENGVIFAPLLVLGDYVARPNRTQGRWGVYILFAGLLIAYLSIRHMWLGEYFTMPGRPYAYPPGTPGFTRFVIDKFIYYVLGLFAYFPIMGFSGMSALRAHPLLFYGTFAGIVLAWGTLLWWFGQRRVLGLWILLALLPLIPVLPVFASSHHVYLASAGMIIATVTAARWIEAWAKHRATAGGRLIQAGIGVLIVLHLIAFTGANIVYDAGMAGFSAASQLPVTEAVRFSGKMKPGDRLFFINLPMLGFNCIPGIEEATGVSPLKGYALTFAPSMLTMNRQGHVEQVGKKQLRVRLDDDGYFSGLIGESVLEAAGRDRPFEVGETFSTPDFWVEVTRASEKGVGELLFRFDRPLDDPAYHFFFASPRFSAYPLRFEPVNKKTNP